jgi:PAB-dependent poly(A)-specific ribonuclease subunit 2
MGISHSTEQLEMASYLTSAAVSPTGAYMAFGDSDGTIHLITADEGGSLPFNGFDGQPIEWADTPDLLPAIEWDNSTYVGGFCVRDRD